jgi:hypothetical protein
MEGTDTRPVPGRPECDAASDSARREFEALLAWCRTCGDAFAAFEVTLAARVMTLAGVLVRLFLQARHERLDLTPHLAGGGHRRGDGHAERRLRTRFGEVRYRRAYLIDRAGGPGYHPLDAELGLTRDGLSPWVMSYVSRLATRLSYAATVLVCRASLGWSPSAEAVRRLVLGLGRRTDAYFAAMPRAEPEGAVLVIEVDGKCTPTATAAELQRRRRPHGPRGRGGCRCQRHRGRARRRRRGPRRRRRKGDHSKNGREVTVVVTYTLRRGPDGQLHGPINKKVWASYAGRVAAARWARAEATRRGFPPGTPKVVQVVMDGAKGLRQNLAPLFPEAILTLDVRHVEEKLWAAAYTFDPEGSAAAAARVDAWQALLYRGRAEALVADLKRLAAAVPRHGPGTKRRRTVLGRLVKYLEPRLGMMRYGAWRAQDLVIASGQVEGAVRHVVGQRMDAAGMRWIPGFAQALLRLRCVEINGDWEAFFAAAYAEVVQQLHTRDPVCIRTREPIPLTLAA